MLRSSLFWGKSIWTLLTKGRCFVQQTAQTDCGVASALTVLKLLGRKSDPVHAVDQMDPDRAGTSLDTLRLYFAQTHGIEAKSMSVPAGMVEDVKGHAILHMSQQHYVVLIGAHRGGILVFDPSVGPVVYPMEDFASLYSGHLLEIQSLRRGEKLPATKAGAGVVGGREKTGFEPITLFITGLATRLLECAVLLCLVAVLYLVLNRASFSSLLMAFGQIVVCGGLLLLAHQFRFVVEDEWIRRRQSRLWQGMIRTLIRGHDLNGFRGRDEREVASSLRKGLSYAIPRRSQVPASIGAFFAVSALLCLLSPIVAFIHAGLFLFVFAVVKLDDVQVCRRSVRPGIGRYTKLSLGLSLLNSVSAPDLMGEIAKWTVIGFAGFSVLLGALSPIALMFWVLAAMQIVPMDFRRVMAMAPGLAAHTPVSDLTASEVPLRHQRIVGPADLTVQQDNGLIQIDGISPLTNSLHQSDLTVREQRLIMADVVRQTLKILPDPKIVESIGPIRIFGPGQNASQVDFGRLIIAREANTDKMLPTKTYAQEILDESAQDLVLRNLYSCEPGDFPVFWDYRESLATRDLQARLKNINVGCVGHLTLECLTIVKAI